MVSCIASPEYLRRKNPWCRAYYEYNRKCSKREDFFPAKRLPALHFPDKEQSRSNHDRNQKIRNKNVSRYEIPGIYPDFLQAEILSLWNGKTNHAVIKFPFQAELIGPAALRSSSRKQFKDLHLRQINLSPVLRIRNITESYAEFA